MEASRLVGNSVLRSTSLRLPFLARELTKLFFPCIRMHASNPRFVVETQALQQCGFHRLVHRAFGLDHAHRRISSDFFRHRHCLFQHFVGRHNLIDDTEFPPLFSIKTAASEDEFLCFLITDKARQALTGATAGKKSVHDFWQAEYRIVGDNSL